MGAVFDSRICRPDERSNNRLERSGETPAVQPGRWAARRKSATTMTTQALMGESAVSSAKSAVGRAQRGASATTFDDQKGATKMGSPSEQSRFAAILAHSGMHVPEEQWPSLLEGYQHMQRLLDLLARPATLDAEPAVTFAPDQR